MDIVEKIKEFLIPELRDIKIRLSRLEEEVSEVKSSLARVETAQERLGQGLKAKS